MKSILRLFGTACLAACCTHAAHAADDVIAAAWNDALAARLVPSTHDGHAVLTITPSVPGGANFVFEFVGGPTDGFYSTQTPASGSACQPGETLGDCRQRALAFVAAYWGSLLQSSVPIVADVSMPVVIDCASRPPYYGAAGPNYERWDFPNAPHPGTAYTGALANALAGQDLAPSSSEMQVMLNEGADHGCEGSWAGWWYGTDADAPMPEDRLPFVTVMLHEFAHALGFQPGYLGTDGSPHYDGITPAWGYYLYDTGIGKLWKDMNDSERSLSLHNDPHVVWTGPQANRWIDQYLGRPVDLVVTAPLASAGTYITESANAGLPLHADLTRSVVIVDDGVGNGNPLSLSDGCEVPFANAAELAGKIALVNLYTCPLGRKMANARSQGAAAVLIANLSSPGPTPMYVTGEDSAIPAFGIEQAIGDAMFAAPSGTFNVTLRPQAASERAGSDDGCVRMHAPAATQPGSALAHFSADARPGLLMTPSQPVGLRRVGLALRVLEDSGWRVRAEDGLFVDGFDPSACLHVQP
jgi:hypothetical protein